MQASRIVSLSNVNSCWGRDEFLSQKRCIHSLIVWLYVDSFSVERWISSISMKFRTNSFFSSWDLWSFGKICFRFLYNINSVPYIVRKLCNTLLFPEIWMELYNFRIGDSDIGLTKITSFICYSWFTVIDTFVTNCKIYCQMPCYGLYFIWIMTSNVSIPG